MATFVLVTGHFTGGWVWQQTAERLRATGAEVHAVTLTGLGEGATPAGPDTRLETHIEDVVRVIDAADAPEVVLVGHDYGIHPVVGAADRRPHRVTRIVHLDAGMPQDGDAALLLVPDQDVRELLMNGGATEGDRLIAPPKGDAWQLWGSTVGLGDEHLAQLDAHAAPQPAGTLTEPLRLTGAAADVPTSGILCTASGLRIATIEMLVASGPPQFRRLADPRVGFFELETGHWPMLSAPEELAGVLVRAAAGEGQRVTAPDCAERPGWQRPFVLDVPERTAERTGEVDLYLPDGEGPHPAVVFVHGGPVPKDMDPTPRDTPMYVGYGRFAASLGAVGVTLNHRLHALTDYAQAAADIDAAVDLVRADPRVDGDRIALWFYSGGGLLCAHWLAAPPSWLRTVAASYPVLAPLPDWRTVDARFRPIDALDGADGLPIVLTRAGLEHVVIAATVERFLTAAAERGTDVEVIDVPNGHHGFEVIDDSDESREALHAAMRAVLARLTD